LLNLIMNENMKIYRRIRTWILIAIQLVVEGLALWIYHANTSTPEAHTLWSAMIIGTLIINVTLFLSVIIAADIVAGEFSGGTIKLLLIRPASRAKILLSKYISTMGFLLFLLLLLFITSYIVIGLMYGFGSISNMYSYMGKDGATHEISMASEIFRLYGFGSIQLIMILTLCFMLSTVFRSSAIAITLSMVSIFVGETIGRLIMQYTWSKYYLFLNTDLSIYLTKQVPVEGASMTLQFSIMILIVYFVIFNALSWYVFKKRDVAS
jgi:ABC-2 type transport system permease protein